jgi:uncharacterized protein
MYNDQINHGCRKVFGFAALMVVFLGSACGAAPENMILKAVVKNDAATVQRLIDERHVDVNYRRPSNGDSALASASGLGRSEIVALLLMRGADPNVTDNDGHTPLIRAAYRGNSEIVFMLVSAGAQIDMAEKLYGYTALAVASAEGHLETVRMLLEAGANTNIVTRTGMTPLQLALKGGHTGVAALIAAARK